MDELLPLPQELIRHIYEYEPLKRELWDHVIDSDERRHKKLAIQSLGIKGEVCYTPDPNVFLVGTKYFREFRVFADGEEIMNWLRARVEEDLWMYNAEFLLGHMWDHKNHITVEIIKKIQECDTDACNRYLKHLCCFEGIVNDVYRLEESWSWGFDEIDYINGYWVCYE
jgi:hypothetical protein